MIATLAQQQSVDNLHMPRYTRPAIPGLMVK